MYNFIPLLQLYNPHISSMSLEMLIQTHLKILESPILSILELSLVSSAVQFQLKTIHILERSPGSRSQVCRVSLDVDMHV